MEIRLSKLFFVSSQPEHPNQYLIFLTDLFLLNIVIIYSTDSVTFYLWRNIPTYPPTYLPTYLLSRSCSTLEGLIFHLDASPKTGGFFLSQHYWAIPEKIQTEVVKTYFLQKIPGIFRFVTLSLEILEKTNLHLRKFHKIVLQTLGIPRPKANTHGKST